MRPIFKLIRSRSWRQKGEKLYCEALALAKANKIPVASMPDERSANAMKSAKTMKESSVMAMKQATLKAERPTGKELTIIDVFETPPRSERASKRRISAFGVDLLNLDEFHDLGTPVTVIRRCPFGGNRVSDLGADNAVLR